MKICHLDTELPWRGGEQQLLYLAQGLRAQGDQNVIAARARSALAARAKAEGFEVIEIEPWLEWGVLSAAWLRGMLISGDFDILHSHTAHAAALGALSTAGAGIPLIAARRVDFHISANPLSLWKYRQAARVIAVSRAIKKVLLEDGLKDEQVAVVHSGVDPARLEPERPPLSRSVLGLPDGPLVGQIAALAPHKDPLNFLRMFAILKKERPEARAVLVGSGPLEEDVRLQIARLSLEGSVTVMGFRPDAHRLLRHFEVFVLSSYLEGLGTSILDAMALGVPVVATDTGGIPEMVVEGVSGLLAPPRDPEKLARAVERVLRDPGLRKRLVQGGHQTIQRFSVPAMVGATRLIYEEALAQAAQATKKAP